MLGDSCNYLIGKRLGSAVYERDSRWIRRDHLDRAHAFFERHGGKAIVIARFMPFLRTFVPFVAGVGGMEWYGRSQAGSIKKGSTTPPVVGVRLPTTSRPGCAGPTPSPNST